MASRAPIRRTWPKQRAAVVSVAIVASAGVFPRAVWGAPPSADSTQGTPGTTANAPSQTSPASSTTPGATTDVTPASAPSTTARSQPDESDRATNSSDDVGREAEERAVALNWLQYGAAFVFESRAAPGGVCPSGATVPCILGSGGGVALRLGTRRERIWYLGGEYQFTKHEASNLLRLPILQQLRFETRRYFGEGTKLAPYMLGQVGAALYGGEWQADTYGAVLGVGAGVEYQVSRQANIGFGAAYHGMYFDGWVDRVGQARNGGLAHFIGLEITLEARGRFKRAEP
ncbi:MAG: hypothetical protein U0165_14090 [Polyangiaceae bacterium]